MAEIYAGRINKHLFTFLFNLGLEMRGQPNPQPYSCYMVLIRAQGWSYLDIDIKTPTHYPWFSRSRKGAQPSGGEKIKKVSSRKVLKQGSKPFQADHLKMNQCQFKHNI